MKVMLVDDEPRVLQALNRVLRHSMPKDWELTTASSGSEALAKLGGAPVDVVVSDLRMPEMDGTVLLGEIRARWPDTVRVVLSGYSDPDMSTKVASVAHQFFEKPLAVADLVDTLRRIEQVRHGVVASPLREVLGAIGDLPGAPTVFVELSAATCDPRARTETLAAIVRRDPGLVAKVMQLAGSAFFTHGAPATDLTTAISRLGIRTVAAMALAANAFRPDPTSGLHHVELCAHSLAAAAIAQASVDPGHAEDAFIAALLADIGLAALACWMPARIVAARAVAVQYQMSLADAERGMYGITHGEVGAYVLGLWRLPPVIVEAVALHHTHAATALDGKPVAQAVFDAHATGDQAID